MRGLSIDAKVESSALGAASFQDFLIQDLKNNLKLPEYGEVKARIRISSKGEVLQMEVLSSQSDKNKKYLYQELMHMRFSWFSTITSSVPFFDFVITFENEKS